MKGSLARLQKTLAAMLPWIKKAAGTTLLLAAFFGGIALVAVGLALIYLPAGLIFAGAALATCAILYERSKSETSAP